MSSIRDAAYSLCKSVWESPSIAELRDAYRNIHSTWFEYHIRQFDAQFLAYLLLDDNLDRLNQMTRETIPHLLPHERDLLISAHHQIVELNYRCLEPIRVALPQLVAEYMPALDPYNRFVVRLSPPAKPATLITSEAMESMAKSFHSHPAFALAIENQTAYARQALITFTNMGNTGPNTTKQVLDWTQFLTSKGATDTGSALTQLILSQKDLPSRPPARFVSALASLRSSLNALNQLIYQLTISNKLPMIDDDNAIDIRVSSGIVSRLADVVFQMSDKLPLVITGQLIRIKVSGEPDMLARTESWALEFADRTIAAVLRDLDENLNPFGPLLKKI